MTRKLCIMLTILSLFSFACGKKKSDVVQTKEDNIEKVNSVASNNLTNLTSTASIKEDPLTRANKDYMIAYNKYVMSLRESGPQTMETLLALAEYQKKYKIYQMVKREQKR